MKFLFLLIYTFLCIFQKNICMEQIVKPENTAREKLLKIIDDKKSIFGVSVESRELTNLLLLLPYIAPYICLIKIVIEQYNDASVENINALKQLAHQYNFMILQDSKFADSQATVKARYTDGHYHIADWADFVTVHLVEGSGILNHLLDALLQKEIQEPRGAFVITQKTNLLTPQYTKTVLRSIQYNQTNFIAGIIHVSYIPTTTIHQKIVRVQEEEIDLKEPITKIHTYFSEIFQEKKSDICFLKLNNSNEIEKVSNLHNLYCQEYQNLNIKNL